MAILEGMLLLLLVFRWIFAVIGTVFVLLLFRFRYRWLNTSLKWIVILLIFLLSTFVLFSLYVILVIDLGIPLPTF
jgi:hypothetical protein